MKFLQALFLDFDGVIVDSVVTKTEAFRKLFNEYGEDVVKKVLAYHRQHGGVSRVEKIRYASANFLKKPLSEQQLSSLSNQYSGLVVEQVIRCDWVKGAKEMLDAVVGKVPVFVISGTPELELIHIIKQRGMALYFDEILGSPVTKVLHIKNLLNKYKLNKDRCVFVGDALTDYDAAIGAGLNFVGIYTEVEFPEGTLVLPDCQGILDHVLTKFRF